MTLDEIRAKRDAIIAARKQRESASAPARELAAAEQELADEEAYDRLSVEHDRLAVVATPGGKVYLRAPKQIEYRNFMDRQDTSVARMEEFVRKLVLYPQGPRLEELLDRYVAIVPHLARAALVLAGNEEEELAKKS